MGKREREFHPGEPIYARDMNDLIYSTTHWHANVDAQKNYLLNVGGIECLGNINVRGTFLINGTPIMAFRPVPEKVIERTVAPLITEKIIERAVDVTLEEGDNVLLERTPDGVKIHSDPGDWVEFAPAASAQGQYIVYGPICFIQIHVSSSKVPSVRLTLPFPSFGKMKQSLGGYMIADRYIDVDGQITHWIGGAYRIA